MKLIRFEIGELPSKLQFRSLYPGFKINFRNPDVFYLEEMERFYPFCLVGLNGTGKSNLLEALASVFFHLECCVASYLPESFYTFRPDTCHPDAFLLEYLIQPSYGEFSVNNYDWVRIEKKQGEVPVMKVKKINEPDSKFSLIPILVEEEKKDEIAISRPARGKIYLPDIVIAYSSGENEILSIPFLKSRLINFDKYKEDFIKGKRFEYPENSLIYIDRGMSQSVLLSCLMYEDPDTTLSFLKEELSLLDIVSFRMNINLQMLNSAKVENAYITEHIEDILNKLKQCATCWYKEEKDSRQGHCSVLTLDFWVNKETKDAFRKLFPSTFDCFRFFQVLYELNAYFISDAIKHDVYASKGVYTEGKLPDPEPAQDVFHFLDFMILKKIKDSNITKELLLREFSDGEHQLLHTIGICLMLKEKRCLMLLDEPETHFNPEWRSKFISILNHGLKSGGGNNLLKEILITSHSAYIISDCIPERVLIFERDNNGKVKVLSAEEKGYKTYGTSVNLLNNRIFKEKHTIGKYAMERIDEYRKKLEEDIPLNDLIDDLNEEMGDSIEKVLLIQQFSNTKD